MSSSKQHSVPESAAGILYQLQRAVFRLAECGRDAVVGVETDDDVTVIDPGAADILEQDKLSMKPTAHPFQNRGLGLWNTLHIWLKASSVEGSAHRAAELHLVTNRVVPESALVRRIAKSDQTEEEIQGCITELRALGKDPSDTTKKIMVAVCKFDDESLAQVIHRIRLFDASNGTVVGEIRSKTIGLLHLPPEANDSTVYQGLLGWVHDVLAEAWQAKNGGWIKREAFDRQLDALLRSQKAQRKRERAERFVVVSKDDRDGARSRPFVERLIDVDLDLDDIDRAIDCFLRFGTERFRLADEGDIVADEWSDFFEHLCERWGTIRRRVARNNPSVDPERLGQIIFRDTADEGYLAPLAGRSTDHSYLTSGGYHRLADNNRVWWHPDFESNRQESAEPEDDGS